MTQSWAEFVVNALAYVKCTMKSRPDRNKRLRTTHGDRIVNMDDALVMKMIIVKNSIVVCLILNY